MRLIRMISRSLAVLAMFYATQASAFFYVDDTTGSPTYNRALADFSGLSAVGTDVNYDTFAFSVDTAGLYDFRSIVLPYFPSSGRWDNFLFLYQGSFDPGNATLNGVAGNDDFNSTIGLSGFDGIALSTGTTYILVTTSFDNEVTGRYLNVIRGPGEVTAPVPEPETYAMLLSGLAVLVFLVRRRRQD